MMASMWLNVMKTVWALSTLGLIPNSAIDGPWADARVRRALCYAIDVDAHECCFPDGYGTDD